MYTLKLTSLDSLAERSEDKEMTAQSAIQLLKDGWAVIVIDLPSYKRDDGEMSTPRQRIEARRTISRIQDVREYWSTKLIGYEAERIGVTFSDAHIDRILEGATESGLVVQMSILKNFRYYRGCTSSDQVEIFVAGGDQNGQDNFWKFLTILDSWDKKFRVMRKLHQLIGVAIQKNSGAIERLRGEIIDQLVTL